MNHCNRYPVNIHLLLACVIHCFKLILLVLFRHPLEILGAPPRNKIRDCMVPTLKNGSYIDYATGSYIKE